MEKILSRGMLTLPSMCPSRYSSAVLTSSNTAPSFVSYSATLVLMSTMLRKKLNSPIFFSLQHCFDLLFRSEAYNLILELSVFDYSKHRDAHYLKLCRKFGLFVHINFTNPNIASLICNLRYDRANRTARTAPIGIEVEKNRFIGIQNFTFKIFFTNFNDRHFVSSFTLLYLYFNRFEIRIL